MFRALNTAATGMKAQQNQIDVTANNIANSSTTGFKRSRAEFEDLMYQTQLEPGAATGLNSITPSRMNRKFTDIVPSIPGSCTFNPEARTATAR